jgi:glycerophosphoryl diester phosphodiesterase
MRLDQVRVIAHRGNSSALPENSMAAFRSAMLLGAHMVEADVHLSREGTPVVIHDDTLTRTTTSTAAVASLHADQLARLGVPALEDVLALPIAVNVEVKVEAAIPSVVELVHGRDDVLVSSFELDALEFLRKLAPAIPVAFLCDAGADAALVLARAAEAGAYALTVPVAVATPALVSQAHAAGLRIMAYTVNNAAEAQGLYAAGVDALFTDDPASILAIL